MRALALAGLACLPLLTGCVSEPIMGGVPGQVQEMPRIHSAPKTHNPAEPAFCVTQFHGAQWGIYGMFTSYGRFRSLRKAENGDTTGCEVLVKIDHPGISIFTLDTIQAFSAYDGALLWEGRSKGRPGVIGACLMAPNLRMAFQPGQPAYERLAKYRPASAAPAVAAAAPAVPGASQPVGAAPAAAPAAPLPDIKTPFDAPAETVAERGKIKLSMDDVRRELLP